MELRLGEKFKIIKKIGSGAFGEIYKGMRQLRFNLFRAEHTNQRGGRRQTGKSWLQ